MAESGLGHLDIPLVKGPFVSLSESFAKEESIEKLASDGLLHPIMPGLIGYRNFRRREGLTVEEALRELGATNWRISASRSPRK